ncbi:MAG: DUF1640 domain-containing protein [Aestuariivita sp.]|nr:DUF1640 domain-containing protein [Aestuariivita sp.]
MTETAFDTHREFQRLRDAGFEDEKAEAIIHSMNAVLIGGVATKTDIEQLKTVTTAEIKSLKMATTAEIEGLKSATKTDIEQLKTVTTAEIEGLKAATTAEIENFKVATTAEIENFKVATEGEFKALKSDIAYLKETAATKAELSKLEAKLAQSETRTTRWIIGTAIAIAGVLIVYFQFIFPGTN